MSSPALCWWERLPVEQLSFFFVCRRSGSLALAETDSFGGIRSAWGMVFDDPDKGLSLAEAFRRQLRHRDPDPGDMISSFPWADWALGTKLTLKVLDVLAREDYSALVLCVSRRRACVGRSRELANFVPSLDWFWGACEIANRLAPMPAFLETVLCPRRNELG